MMCPEVEQEPVIYQLKLLTLIKVREAICLLRLGQGTGFCPLSINFEIVECQEGIHHGCLLVAQPMLELCSHSYRCVRRLELDTSSYQTLFTYTAEEIDAIRKFEEEHAKCMDLFGDFSGALFEYSVVPSGLGTAKEVICGCGDKLTLGDFLDMEEPYIRTATKLSAPQLTIDIIDNIKLINSRPKMYFGNERFASFWYWLMGIEFSMNGTFAGRTLWNEIDYKINRKLAKIYLSKRYERLTPELIIAAEGSDEAAYSAWYSVFEEVMKSGFDEKLAEFGEQ